MKILALEFSSSQRSVAVASGTIVSEVVETAARKIEPLVMIDEALRRSGLEREQIECLAVGLGPGSYTGIRAAIALAQGWQLASRDRGIRLLGISSVEGLAAQAQAEGLHGPVSLVIDAQRNEFYLARYEISSRECCETGPLHLATQAEVVGGSVAEILAGPEADRWGARGRTVFPRAAMLARLASVRNNFVDGEKLEPIYMRETSFAKAPPPRVI
jgi:tRNA threonylcarbamoyl adenosine modification protein YeaZ